MGKPLKKSVKRSDAIPIKWVKLGRKHLYITVEEKEQFKALMKQFALNERTGPKQPT